MYKEIYETMQDNREALETLVEIALRETCSLLPSSRNDTRDCAIVLYEDGTLDTRKMGQGEHFKNADVLTTVSHWIAWEMIPDNRQMIAENDKAQALLVAAAIEQAKADEDDDAIQTLSDWSKAYSYIDAIPDDVRVIMAEDYREWFLSDCDEYISGKADEAIAALRELSENEEAEAE